MTQSRQPAPGMSLQRLARTNGPIAIANYIISHIAIFGLATHTPAKGNYSGSRVTDPRTEIALKILAYSGTLPMGEAPRMVASTEPDGSLKNGIK